VTKKVRIENADMNTSVKLVVQVFDQYGDAEPVLVSETTLGSPCELVDSIYLTSNRYVVIKEAPAN
jgi:hypothetical protein